jgi:hypothetical protein
MGLSRSPLSTVFCDGCKKDTRTVSMQSALDLSGVCKATLYNWMDRGWVHWMLLPNNRRVTCLNSLLRRPLAATPREKNFPDSSISV